MASGLYWTAAGALLTLLVCLVLVTVSGHQLATAEGIARLRWGDVAGTALLAGTGAIGVIVVCAAAAAVCGFFSLGAHLVPNNPPDKMLVDYVDAEGHAVDAWGDWIDEKGNPVLVGSARGECAVRARGVPPLHEWAATGPGVTLVVDWAGRVVDRCGRLLARTGAVIHDADTEAPVLGTAPFRDAATGATVTLEPFEPVRPTPEPTTKVTPALIEAAFHCMSDEQKRRIFALLLEADAGPDAARGVPPFEKPVSANRTCEEAPVPARLDLAGKTIGEDLVLVAQPDEADSARVYQESVEAARVEAARVDAAQAEAAQALNTPAGLKACQAAVAADTELAATADAWDAWVLGDKFLAHSRDIQRRILLLLEQLYKDQPEWGDPAQVLASRVAFLHRLHNPTAVRNQLAAVRARDHAAYDLLVQALHTAYPDAR
jgi:hypothetical protein